MKKIIAVFVGIVIVLSLVFVGYSLLTKNYQASSVPDENQMDNQTDQTIDAEKQIISPSPTQKAEQVKATVKLYFPSGDGKTLKMEKRIVELKDGAIVRATLEALIKGPDDNTLMQTLPASTRILGISLKNKVAVVDFTKEYKNKIDTEELMRWASIVNTATGIEGVEKVRIRVDGKDLTNETGIPVDAMTRFSLDSEGRPIIQESKELTLYFADPDAKKITPETREIQISKGVPIEYVIFSELVKGPKNNAAKSIIPKGTKVLSLSTTEGISTLNLSREFIENAPGGTAAEAILISSIVNSLTELPEVKGVQFLVDGKKRSYYTHIIFNEPFLRDTDLLSDEKS